MRRFIAALALLLLVVVSVKGQGFDRCIDRQIFESLPVEVKKPSLKTRDLINVEARLGVFTSLQYCDPGIRRIPVVFHIIHNGGADSISSSQIQTQMTVLNEDFRKLAGTPGNGTGVDTKIDFFLANRDPNGLSSPGITYTHDSIANFIYSPTNDSLLKGKIKWPQQRYLNIWVVDTIMYGPSYLLGYAHQPSNGANILDGVVVSDQHVGRSSGTANHGPYRYGRTLTHEIGHYLGLWHPFDYVTNPCEGDSAVNCATQGDFVCDVPPHSGPHYGCPTVGPGNNTCTEFPKDTNDFVNNYMEYVNDTCMDMFSAGQATRMFASIDADSFRSILTSTENLNWFSGAGAVYHGIPDPFFVPFPFGTGCVGDSVFFRDYTLGIGPFMTPLPDTKWSWKFVGASPDTSNLQNPSTVWYSPGTKMVTLTVTNGFGICQYPMSISIGGTEISVMNDTVTEGDSTHFFSISNEPGTWAWNFGDGSGDSASFGSVTSHRYPGFGAYQYTATFTPEDTNQCVSVLRDTAFVLENLPVTYRYFRGDLCQDDWVKLTWVTSQEVGSSHFEIERSKDGVGFTKIGSKIATGNSQLETDYVFFDEAPFSRENFYRLKQIDKNGAFEYSKVVEISVLAKSFFSVFPNPVKEKVTLNFAYSDEERRLVLCDLQGRKLIEKSVEKEKNTSRIDLSELGQGIYLLRLEKELGGKLLWFTKIIKVNP